MTILEVNRLIIYNSPSGQGTPPHSYIWCQGETVSHTQFQVTCQASLTSVGERSIQLLRGTGAYFKQEYHLLLSWHSMPIKQYLYIFSDCWNFCLCERPRHIICLFFHWFDFFLIEDLNIFLIWCIAKKSCFKNVTKWTSTYDYSKECITINIRIWSYLAYSQLKTYELLFFNIVF